MKPHKYSSTILNAEDKFSQSRSETANSLAYASRLNLTQLGSLVANLLNDKNLEVSKVRPFFWSLVETYADRFNLYPFDVNKALFSQLESNDYPEENVQQLILQLERRFKETHGRALQQSSPAKSLQEPLQKTLDDEIKTLRDSIKYAVMVDEISE